MEHIVQFGIGIDDDAIVKRVSENAERQIIYDLEKKVAKAVFKYGDYYYDRDDIKGVQPQFEKMFKAFLDEHKDEIIELAVKQLTDKLSRTKAVKEAVVESIRNGDI